MSSDLSLLIGIALAIPLSIGANILTPKLLLWLEKRSKKASFNKSKRLLEEYNQVKSLVPAGELSTYLIMVLIRVALVGAMFGLITGLMYTIILFTIDLQIFYAMAQAIAVLGSLVILRLCLNASRDYQKVRDFESYEKFVLEQIPELRK